MSEIDQGLEVITDENGQQLVKLVIVDENNEATGFAYVTPDEAAQILSGNATLQTNTDETTGETVASVQPNTVAMGGEDVSVIVAQEGSTGDEEAAAVAAAAAGIDPASMDTLSKVINNTDSLQSSTAAAPGGASGGQALDANLVLTAGGQLAISDQMTGETSGEAGSTEAQVAMIPKEQGDGAAATGSGETMVLMDPMGNVIKSEDGQPVLLEIEGQHYEYNPQTGLLTLIEEGSVTAAALSAAEEQGKVMTVSEGDTAAGEATIERGDEYWRPTQLRPEHVEALKGAAEIFVPSIRPEQFQPEPYHKKLGSQMAYREMISLMNYDRFNETPQRLEALRKHAMLFRQAGPHSRPLTVQEQAVNEAAAQVCRILPTLLFHRRELSTYARQIIRITEIDFAYHSQSSGQSQNQSQSQQGQQQQQQQAQQQPTSQPPQFARNIASAQSSGQADSSDRQQQLKTSPNVSSGVVPSGLPNMRKDYTSMLSTEERSSLRSSVYQLQGDLPRYRLKAKDECSVIERYCHEGAVKIMKLPSEKMEECMDFLREVSAIYGRYPSGPRNMSACLTPFEVACNEAAAWLVRLQPALLTYRRELTDMAKKAVRQCGLYFRHTPYTNVSTGGRTAAAADVLYRVGGAGAEFITEPDLSAAESVLHGHLVLPPPTTGTGLLNASLVDTDAALTEAEDFAAKSEEARMKGETMYLECEPVDNVLSEAAILQITGTDDLRRIRCLSVANCGITTLCPIDLARCINLRELDLSNNALTGLPRCLYLPHLRRLDLTNNPLMQSVPLLEQFPRLRHLNIDEKLEESINRQMLAFFCPKMVSLNGKPFNETVTEATRKAVHDARLSIEPHIMSRWETEYAPFYKKGITALDRIKLLESFVLHMYDKMLPFQEESSLNQLSGIGAELSAYKDLITRTFADDFLRPRLVISADPEVGDGNEENDGTTDWAATLGEDLSDDESDSEDVTNLEKQVQTLLSPEEPLEKACVVIGQTMRAGKCVFYSVVRPQGLTGRVIAGTTGPSAAAADMQAALHKSTGLMGASKRTISSPPANADEVRAEASRSPAGDYEDGDGTVIDMPESPVASTSSPNAVASTSTAIGFKASPMKFIEPREPLAAFTSITPKKRVPMGPSMRKEPTGRASPSLIAAQPGPSSAAGRTMSTRDSNRNKRFTADGVVTVGAGAGAVDEYEFVASPPTSPPLGVGRKRPPSMPLSGSPTKGSPLAKKARGAPLPPSMLPPPPPRPPMPAPRKWGSLLDLGKVTDFDPLHFIRCHARDNNPMDSQTKVWRCAFEPRPDLSAKDAAGLGATDTTHTVATCGGECVCLIDCCSGKVLKRFKHLEEEFYTLAWTTVTLEDGQRTNLMAAAGKMAEIRLLHPDQLVCYAEMKGHHDEVACMAFHSRERPTLLFSGDASAAILVWDIGVPRLPDYRTRYHLLMRLRCPRANLNPVLNLVYMPYWSSLVAGCEDGIFAWRFDETQFSPHEYRKEREPDLELRIPTKHEACFDGLGAVHSGIIVTKCVEDGEMIAFDYGATFDSVFQGKKIPQNHSSGTKSIAVPVKGTMAWQPTEEIYINLSCRSSLSTVVCGDNEGSVWIYDIKSQIVNAKKPGAPTNKKFRVKPLKILEWPECSVSGNRHEDQQLKDSISKGFKNPVVNTCDISSDGRYLVAVTDNNLVCIWAYSGGDEIEEDDEEEEEEGESAEQVQAPSESDQRMETAEKPEAETEVEGEVEAETEAEVEAEAEAEAETEVEAEAETEADAGTADKGDAEEETTASS